MVKAIHGARRPVKRNHPEAVADYAAAIFLPSIFRLPSSVLNCRMVVARSMTALSLSANVSPIVAMHGFNSAVPLNMLMVCKP